MENRLPIQSLLQTCKRLLKQPWLQVMLSIICFVCVFLYILKLPGIVYVVFFSSPFMISFIHTVQAFCAWISKILGTEL
jgi:hypothetical protein